MSGFGGGGWGSGPWGGSAAPLLASPTTFDVFCFQDLSMFQILADPDVSTGGNGGSFTPNPVSMDLEIRSGGGAPSDDARLFITANIPQVFTTEWVVKFEDLPNDFTNITDWHIYLGVTDAAGPLVGFFFSKVGVAYTGSVSFPGGNLQLDTVFQVIPGSSDYSLEDEYLVIRAAADFSLNLVYFYVTKASDLPSTGQQLRAILPIIPYDVAATPPTDRALVSVRGTLTQMASAFLASFCVGSALLIPNLAPVANAGTDQAVRACSIIQLNGSQSYDPEGAQVSYFWRLIDVPPSSEFSFEGADGATQPAGPPTGFTDKFYSTELGVEDVADPFEVGVGGDVLLVRGEPYTIVAKGTDGFGFFVQIGDDILVDDMSVEPFKLIRQRGISGADTVTPTFFPDKPGFHRFDLIVFDGALFSEPSVVLVNVLESPLPRGCAPDLSFIFNYLSDFWGLVEGRDRLSVFWSGLAQVVATELYTLWQIEYSKSLRDIQRYFVRRWLHYDLLLAEPLAELTRVRATFGGVTSSFISIAGQGGVNGTRLVISSPSLAQDFDIIIAALNPATAATLKAEVEFKLKRADSRFSISLVTDRATTDVAFRIDAPFPFTIKAGTTLPVLTVGAEDRSPAGSGAGVGSRLYKVDRSLEGLDVKEDDFLVLDGVAFRVARIVDDSNDTYAFQRVLLKEDLPTAPSTSWSISGWVSSELLNFYNGLVSESDIVDLEVTAVSDEATPLASIDLMLTTTVLGVSSVVQSRIAVDTWGVGQYVADAATNVRLARVVRRTYLPIHALIQDVPVLQEHIVITDDAATLRRNVDFFLETYRGSACIRFSSSQGMDVWEGLRPPNRLWAEYTYIDNRPVIEQNFGIPVDFTLDELADLPDTVDYLSAVRGLWYAFFNGPTIRNLRVGTQILLGLPFAEEAGTIEEIRTDISPTEGRLLIRDTERTEIVRSYKFPSILPLEVNPATGEKYKVGDTVAQFAPLVEGAEVIDYIKDPKWFQGLLNQGVFFEVEKYHKFVVRVDDAAFSLNALLFVKNFILKIKPTYTFPLFIVQKTIKDTEVSTTDQTQMTATLLLFDSPCDALYGSSFMYDEPRAAGGGWRNQFDADAVPLIPNGDPDPVFPTADANITWGYDKQYLLCPTDLLIAVSIQTFGAPFTPTYDSVFAYDTPIGAKLFYEVVSPANVPAPPGGLTVTPLAGAAAPFTGTLTHLRLYMLGTPGVSPTDYEVVIDVNGTPSYTSAFTSGVNTELVRIVNVAVTSGDTLAVRIRPASGVAARTPVWSRVNAAVTVQEGVMWTFDDTVPAGTYALERQL